jgi:hypothetical protein
MQKLEEEMQQVSYENAAYETICKVTVANMATFDIEKFKMHRLKVYETLLGKLSISNIEILKDGNDHFEKLLKIMSS